MAACFKLPSLAKRPKPPSQFPEFKWSEVKIEAELGCETFGSVFSFVFFFRLARKELNSNPVVLELSKEKETSTSSSRNISLLRRRSLGSSRNLPPPRTSAETSGYIPYPLFKKISRRARGGHQTANRHLVIVQ